MDKRQSRYSTSSDTIHTDGYLTLDLFIAVLEEIRDQHGGKLFVETETDGDLGLLIERTAWGDPIALLIG